MKKRVKEAKLNKSTSSKTSNFQLFLLIFLTITFIISVAAFKNTLDIKKSLPQTVQVNDFLEKMTAHEQARTFVGVSPLNIIQINEQNLNNLQGQIQGLDETFLGSFIVQYSNAIVVYDYNNDEIKGTLNFDQEGTLPQDFFDKLHKHQEATGLENEQPIGGQLDESTLNVLKEQFPQVYSNAKVGDYLLRYESRLIVYDYNQNKIVVAVNLQ